MYLCPVPTVIVLLVDHPLVIANKIKWHLLGVNVKTYQFSASAIYSLIFQRCLFKQKLLPGSTPQ